MSFFHDLEQRFEDFFRKDIDPTKEGTQTAFERGLQSLWTAVEPEVKADVLAVLETFAATIPTGGVPAAAAAAIAELALKGIQLSKDTAMTLLRITEAGLQPAIAPVTVEDPATV